MKKLTLLLASVFLAFQINNNAYSQSTIKTPFEFFGFQPGSDRKLFNYEELVKYLQLLEQSSPKIKMVQIGQSPMGRPMYVAFISSAENIRNLDRLKEINRELALDAELPEDKVKELVNEGKVFFLATLSMHSNEVGPSQSAPLIAYDLITTSDPAKLKWMNDAVYMMVPCHNPDGMDLVVEHYLKTVGTEFEGSTLPRVYNKYVGHDNNRDFISLTQEDTKAIDRLFSEEWFPQVMVEKHQMSANGPRYFIPPPHDPIAENIDAGIWNWIGLFGSNLMKDMTADSLKGITQNSIFDDYWPGCTETCIWKNVIGFLTEGASAHVATPVYVEENELEGDEKGLADYKKSINFPAPWKGGWWHLSDLVDLEISSTYSILRTSSENRAEILKFRNDICRKEVKEGKTQPPFYYILPAEQHDRGEMAALVNLLMEHGIRAYTLTGELSTNNCRISNGSVVVPLAQPFRAFIKEVMEKQKYPVRHYTVNGEIMKPYDIASWSLLLHRGVDAVEIDEKMDIPSSSLEEITGTFRIGEPAPGDYREAIFSVNNNESYKAAFMAKAAGLEVGRTPSGDFVISRDKGKNSKLDGIIGKLLVSPEFVTEPGKPALQPLVIPRIALVETFMHDMDAGWTRYIFDTFGISYTVIHPGDFEKADLSANYDIVIFPDNSKTVLMDGKYGSENDKYPTSYPPEFTKGMGKKGLARVMDFVNRGGKVLSWGASTELFVGSLTLATGDTAREFRLPVKDVSKDLQKDGLFCPGSLVKMNLVSGSPLTLGMPAGAGIFYRGKPVFATSIPHFDMDRRVIGKFPEDNILMSGYCEKPEKLADQPVMVWLKKGKGQLVLYGFSPQFRASTQGTFKLLFNALLMP